MFMFLRDVCEREVALSCETRREGGGETVTPHGISCARVL